MKRPEDALQMSVVQFLDYALPDGAYYFAVPNGGKRGKAEAAIFKATGVKAGVPDLAVIYNGIYHGIELKAKYRKLSDAQREAHVALLTAGARVHTCWDVGEVDEFLRMYMPLRAAL